MQCNNDRTLRLLVRYIYHFDFFVFVQVISCTCLHGVVAQPFKTMLVEPIFLQAFLSVSLYVEILDPRLRSNNFKSMLLFSWQSSNLEVRVMADLSL